MSAPVVQEGQKEGYWAKVKRTGDVFEQKAGTGLPGIARTAVAAGENALAIGSGLVGDVAGAATSAITQDPKKGESVRKAITTQPATEAGQAAQEYLGAITEPVSKALGAAPAYLKRKGYPISGQAATAAEDVLLGRGGKFGEVARETEKTAAQTAISAGYKIKPSNAGAKVATVPEGLAGSARLGREIAVKNQSVTNKLAGEELGLKNTKVVTPLALKEAKAPHNAVYDEVGQKLGEVVTDNQYKEDLAKVGRTPGTSFPSAKDPAIEQLKTAYSEERFHAADGVQETRKLRAAAKKNIKAHDAPERNELGYAQLQISNAIEAQMERYGQQIGQVDLMNRFRAARQSLAKIHSVENALIGETGDVSASGLAKQLDRGVPLSGKLRMIADTAKKFPEEMRDAEKLRDKTPVTVLEGVVGMGGAAALHNPLFLGAMAARPLTRAALKSKRYQHTLANPPQLNIAPATQAALATEEAGKSE